MYKLKFKRIHIFRIDNGQWFEAPSTVHIMTWITIAVIEMMCMEHTSFTEAGVPRRLVGNQLEAMSTLDAIYTSGQRYGITHPLAAWVHI